MNRHNESHQRSFAHAFYQLVNQLLLLIRLHLIEYSAYVNTLTLGFSLWSGSSFSLPIWYWGIWCRDLLLGPDLLMGRSH